MLPDDPEPQPPVQPHGGIRLLHRERDGRIALVGQQSQHRPQQPRPDTPSPAGRIECHRKLRNSLRDTAEPRAAADPDGLGDERPVVPPRAEPGDIVPQRRRQEHRPRRRGRALRNKDRLVQEAGQQRELRPRHRPYRRIHLSKIRISGRKRKSDTPFETYRFPPGPPKSGHTVRGYAFSPS